MQVLKLIFIFFLFSSQLFCEFVLNKQEKEWISQNPTIKVGVDANWPPFDYIDATGKNQGISSEYLNIISKKTGLKFDIYANDWSNVISKIKKNELDVLACVANIEERKHFLDFSKSYLDIDLVVIGKKETKIKKFDEIKNYTVVVQKDNYIHEKLKTRFPNIKFLFVKSNEEAFKAISYGKADFYIGNLAVITYFIEKDLLTNLEVKFKTDLKKARLSIGVVKEKEILVQIINKVLNSISKEEHTLIRKKWIFNDKIQKKSNKKSFTLTKEEKAWIKANPVVKMGIDGDWIPFDFLDKVSGRQDGIGEDYLEIISKKTGLKFKIFATGWKDSFAKIKTGEIDIFKSMIVSPYAKKYTNLTIPYIWSTTVILGKKSSILEKIEDIKNFKVGVLNLRTAILEKIKKKFPSKEFIPIKSDKEGIKKLLDGEIDFFIGNSVVLRYFIKKNYLTNLEIKYNLNLSKINVAIGVNKDKKVLFNILNKALNSIDSEEKENIKEKWIGKDSKLLANSFNFSKKEKEWLRNHKTIRMASDPSFAPYIYI